ncbi:MarR family winged helix-turn-helix transcriptional regulator [Paenibacillus ehimensis]|uniref:MarR family winged helix-turn-helix transcriptional regulator n=1 Tax=Paenibacillus ehimensis TaxID=79264 RepID=UPI00046FE605|nr:MarR family winged helix-turn-helix transcriptional regulator [Paenibacillus ehimensis]
MRYDPQQRKENRAARVSMALVRMAQAVKKIGQMESDDTGLSPVQIQSLLFTAHTRGDVASVGSLADHLGTTHVTAVKIVNGLVIKGLIAKYAKPGDRRITLLQLTSQGEEAVAKLDRWGEALEEAVQSLPEEALASLETGLGAVLSALQRRGHLVVAEPCLGCIHFRPNTGQDETPHYCNLIRKFLTHEATLKQCPEHKPSFLAP